MSLFQSLFQSVFRRPAPFALALIAAAQVAPAQAATWRYSFDVVTAQVYFTDMYKYATDAAGTVYQHGQPVEAAWAPGEIEYYMTRLHPLGSLYGQTGTVVMDLVFDPADVVSYGVSSEIRNYAIVCVSGIFCQDDAMADPAPGPWAEYHQGRLQLPGFGTGGPRPASLWGQLDEVAGTGYLRMNPDAFIAYSSPSVRIWDANAEFELANVTRTVMPVPLPAGVVLLGSGLVLAGLFRRRAFQDARPCIEGAGPVTGEPSHGRLLA